MDTPAIRMKGITKHFGETLANDRVDFELRDGEIHALLGENGAGKSTLMNILSGFYQPDDGLIEVYGRPAAVTSPRKALALGIGMVHQHFMLVKGHTVAENIILGIPRTPFFLNATSLRKKIEALAARYRLPVDPGARIWQLSIGERQRVEILKLLFRETKVLILDEPTSVLSPREVEGFFDTLRQIKRAGGAVVFISHKLEEVMSISDRVTVLRGGRAVATVDTRNTTAAGLAVMMVGKLAVPAARMLPAAVSGREVPLEMEGVWSRNDRGLVALHDMNLTVNRGEIFGLLGVAGNGQKELVEVSTGLRRPLRGRVLVNGRDLTGSSPRRFIDAGVAHIPEDRLGRGVVGTMTLAENLFLKRYRQRPSSSGFLLDIEEMNRAAGVILRSYDVQPDDPLARAGTLSGGNIQRLILAREIGMSPLLLVAAYPFQGLDVSATDFLGRTLLKCATGGMAVLLVGEDLDLTLSLSHRVGVIYEGRLKGVMSSDRVKVENLGLLMAGHALEERDC